MGLHFKLIPAQHRENNMNMAFGQVVTLALVLSLPDFSGVHCT